MDKHCSRKEALKLIVLLPAVGSTIIATRQIAEARQATRASVKYQNTPKRNQKCSGCHLFIPHKSNPKAFGKCQVVQGAISPNSWCTV